jgi:GT2 family glycosyltransferase
MIDIIILTYNHLEMTKRCIESIKTKHPYNLIVVDSGSTDGTIEYLHKIKATLVWLSQPFCFAESVNAGLRIGHNHYKLICNNDIEFRGEAIDAMLETLNEEGVGLVGPSSNGVMNSDQQKVYASPKETTRTLNFFCVMTHRGVLDAVGYMDRRFTGYGCDDDDFSIRVLKAGYKLMIAPAYVHHDATTTYKETNKATLFLKNKMQFFLKWGLAPAQDWSTVELKERNDIPDKVSV